MPVAGNDAVERTLRRTDRGPLDILHIDVAQHLDGLAAFARRPVGGVFPGIERLGEHLQAGARNDAARRIERLPDGGQSGLRLDVLNRKLDHTFALGFRVAGVLRNGKGIGRLLPVRFGHIGNPRRAGHADDRLGRCHHIEFHLAFGRQAELAVGAERHIRSELINGIFGAVTHPVGRQRAITPRSARIGVAADAERRGGHAFGIRLGGLDDLAVNPFRIHRLPFRKGFDHDLDGFGIVRSHHGVNLVENEDVTRLVDGHPVGESARRKGDDRIARLEILVGRHLDREFTAAHVALLLVDDAPVAIGRHRPVYALHIERHGHGPGLARTGHAPGGVPRRSQHDFQFIGICRRSFVGRTGCENGRRRRKYQKNIFFHIVGLLLFTFVGMIGPPNVRGHVVRASEPAVHRLEIVVPVAELLVCGIAQAWAECRRWRPAP